MAVPNGLDPAVAALTEPMAVALHAVRRGEVGKRDVAIVIGCGPVGLGVVLHAEGERSAHGRRQRLLARPPHACRRCGADVVVDPVAGLAVTGRRPRAPRRIFPRRSSSPSTRARSSERLPFGWWHTWRLAERLGLGPKRPVIFECVGVPGVIYSIVDGAPLFSRVVVVGVCVGLDTFTPALAINKEIDLRFVLGYTPLEFRDTLHMLAEGKVDPSPMITGTVGLDGVAAPYRARGPREAREDPDRPEQRSCGPLTPGGVSTPAGG